MRAMMEHHKADLLNADLEQSGRTNADNMHHSSSGYALQRGAGHGMYIPTNHLMHVNNIAANETNLQHTQVLKAT